MTDFKPFAIKPQTVREAINHSTQFLINENITNARNEVIWFLENHLATKKISFYEIIDNPLSDSLYLNLKNFLNQRAQQIPFQHILKKASFYGRDFWVEKCALIPRPESETIIEAMKKNQSYGKKLLDIGTGTGCIGITAGLEKIANKVHLIDIDSNILRLAKKNCKAHNLKKVEYYKLDIFSSIPRLKYDIIVSNPPYIPRNELSSLEDSVRLYEPMKALTDFEDGYKFYHRYAKIFKAIMSAKAIALLEISHSIDLKKIKNIFKEFSDLKFYNDLNGDPRVVSFINN